MGVAMACDGCGAMITVSPNFKGRRASCSGCRKKEKENRGGSGGGPTFSDRPIPRGADHVPGGRSSVLGKASSRGGGGGGGGGQGPGSRNREAGVNVIACRPAILLAPGLPPPPPPQPGTDENIRELQARRAAEMGKLRSLGASGDDGEFYNSSTRTIKPKYANISSLFYPLLTRGPTLSTTVKVSISSPGSPGSTRL